MMAAFILSQFNGFITYRVFDQLLILFFSCRTSAIMLTQLKHQETRIITSNNINFNYVNIHIP